MAGRRLLRIDRLPAEWALDSVRVGTLDVTDTGVDVAGDLAGIEVVVTTSPAHVKGTVVDAQGIPSVECSVVVFPREREKWSIRPNRFVALTHTGRDGAFSVDEAMPVGDYFAAAVNFVDPGDLAEPEMLERLVPHAARFSLSEHEQKHLTLKMASQQ